MTYFVDAYARMLANPSACPAPSDFFLKTNHFELQIGQPYAREMMLEAAPLLIAPAASVSASDAVQTLAAAIKARWADDVAVFTELRRPYLLYPEN